jgi:ABC-2 type transport system ATP-binding protein
MSIVSINNVVKKYDSHVALNGVSLRIDRPIMHSLLGPNGAGKTTLINIIVGLLKPDEGSVSILGRSPTDPEARYLIGYCPQEHGLIERLTGYDNALFYGRLYGLQKKNIIERVNEFAEPLGLSRDDLKRRVEGYSGGMKRKLALIVSLIHDPKILVLDEPTTGMDPGVRRQVWDLLLRLKREGKTILLATHYMEEADRLSDNVSIMDRGRIIAEGTPEQLKRTYGPRTVITLRLEEQPTDRLKTILSEVASTFYFERDTLRIQVEDPDTSVPVILERLYSNGFHVLEFRIMKPTLEDVFIRLTGRRIEEE